MIILMRTSISFIVSYTSHNKFKKTYFTTQVIVLSMGMNRTVKWSTFITRVLKDNKCN